MSKKVELYRGITLHPGKNHDIFDDPNLHLANVPSKQRPYFYDFRQVWEEAIIRPENWVGFSQMEDYLAPVIYGTTDKATASMYAKSRTRDANTSEDSGHQAYVMAFEAEIDNIFVDPHDFVADVFSWPPTTCGKEKRMLRHTALQNAFGKNFGDVFNDTLHVNENQLRIVMANALCFSRDAVEAHLDSPHILEGKNRIKFRNAFGVFLPVNILRIERAEEEAMICNSTYSFRNLF